LAARALALNPNLIHAHAAIGAAKLFMGRAEETGAHINDALRLSPRDTYAYVWLFIAGMAKLSVGRDGGVVASRHRDQPKPSDGALLPSGGSCTSQSNE
jgi:hypothetical protein